MIAVADDKRERRPERLSLAQTGQDLQLVLLDLLSGRAAVTLLAAAKVGPDLLLVELQTRR